MRRFVLWVVVLLSAGCAAPRGNLITREFAPGCEPAPVPVITRGVFQTCSTSFDCAAGFSCEKRWIDPCADSDCEACGAQRSVCVQN